MNHHVAAGSRGDHDRALGRLEHGNRVPRGGTRLVVEAGIERRLPAAGLRQRNLHLVAKPFEHTNDGESDVRRELVDEAGVKQLGDGHGWEVESVESVE